MITGQEALPLEAGAIPELAQGIGGSHTLEAEPTRVIVTLLPSEPMRVIVTLLPLRGNGRAGEHQFTLLQSPRA